LLAVLREVLEEKGCIENYFLLGYKDTDQNIISALSKFCESLLDRFMKHKKAKPTKGLQYLLTNPSGGSACKRLNLFLRWMVRRDEVDPGLWSSVDKAKLIVPVDVHMARLCRILKLYDQKTVSLAAAVKITESFAEFEPTDPVKYDFALSRIGILEDCNGKLRPKCQDCELLEFCHN